MQIKSIFVLFPDVYIYVYADLPYICYAFNTSSAEGSDPSFFYIETYVIFMFKHVCRSEPVTNLIPTLVQVK